MERRAAFQVLSVRTSVPLSNVRHGFKGMWLGGLMVPEVGCIPGPLSFPMSQAELTMTYLDFHLASNPRQHCLIPARLLRDVLAS